MGRVAEWVQTLKAFHEFTRSPEAEETQLSAKRTEAFVRQVTETIFPDAWLFKTGSQQHPDFLVTNQSVRAQIEAYAVGPRGRRRRITKGLLLEWEKLRGLEIGVRLLRLEVKSTTGATFVLNDTFPNPDPAEDELYVMFAGADSAVYVTTSATMATFPLGKPPGIPERYTSSDQAVADFGNRLKLIWSDTPVGTAARPTYSIDVSYARTEPALVVLERLFERAGLHS